MFAKYIVKSRNRQHHGVDFAAPQGTPVYAASSGVVLNADIGSLSEAFGKVVLIEHGDKLQSLSAHLSRIDVRVAPEGERLRISVRDNGHGIDPANMFGFWDWVGGRFSLWSAIGLPAMIALGPQRFDELLEGARAMDEHFRTTPFATNLPVLMALIGIWNVNFLDAPSQLIAPYHQRLHRLPAYLQQLDMESNGKSVRHDGSPVPCRTSPILWGEQGINGQHAYFQLVHQGTQPVPVDFIGVLDAGHEDEHLHRIAFANLVAQAEALVRAVPDWGAVLLCGDADLAYATGLRAAKVYPIFNGAIECSLITVDPVAPARREDRPPALAPAAEVAVAHHMVEFGERQGQPLRFTEDRGSEIVGDQFALLADATRQPPQDRRQQQQDECHTERVLSPVMVWHGVHYLSGKSQK